MSPRLLFANTPSQSLRGSEGFSCIASTVCCPRVPQGQAGFAVPMGGSNRSQVYVPAAWRVLRFIAVNDRK